MFHAAEKFRLRNNYLSTMKRASGKVELKIGHVSWACFRVVCVTEKFCLKTVTKKENKGCDKQKRALLLKKITIGFVTSASGRVLYVAGKFCLKNNVARIRGVRGQERR